MTDARSIGPLAAARLSAQAEGLLAVGRNAEAVAILQQAISAQPQDLRPRCHLSLALMRLEQYRHALKAAEDAAQLNPEAEWPHRLRSHILLRMRKRRPAVKAAREAVRLAPELPEALYTLASADLANGHMKRAR